MSKHVTTGEAQFLVLKAECGGSVLSKKRTTNELNVNEVNEVIMVERGANRFGNSG